MKKNIFYIAIFIISSIFPFQTVLAQDDLAKAELLYNYKDYISAMPLLESVLKESPENSEVALWLANSYRICNEPAKAKGLYAKYIKNSKEAINYYYYGEVLKMLGEYNQAKMQYIEYAKSNPVSSQYAKSCDFALQNMGVTPSYKLSTLDINSESSDYAPAFFKDKIVFGSSRRIPYESGGVTNWTEKYYNQLYVSSINDDGTLTKPQSLLNIFEQSNNSPVAFFPDNALTVYTTNQFLDGMRPIGEDLDLRMELTFADVVQDNNWANPTVFTVNQVNDEVYSAGQPTVSPDGKTIYFSANLPNGKGGYDIYFCTRTNGGWSSPQNLNGAVNTQGDEMTPFMSNDGQTLYFSSNYHDGFGGMDIFKASKIGNTWDNITNLGIPVNSSQDDVYFIYDDARQIGYFTTNRKGGKGHEDIMMATRIGTTPNTLAVLKNPSNPNTDDDIFEKPATTTTTTSTNPPVVNNNNNNHNNEGASDILDGRRIYRGFVVEKKSSLPMSDVLIRIVNLSNEVSTAIKTDMQGEYRIDLEPYAEYNFSYEYGGFETQKRLIQTGNNSNLKLLGTTNLQKIGEKEEVVLPPVTTPTVAHTIPKELPKNKEEALLPPPPKTTTPPSSSPSKETLASGASVSKKNNSGSGGTVVKDITTLNKKISPNGEGYVVQIATLSENADTKKMEPLKRYGNVLSRKTGNAVVYMVGVYTSRPQAEPALQAAKSSGFKDAFVKKIEIPDELMSQIVVDSKKTEENKDGGDLLPPQVVTPKKPLTPPTPPVSEEKVDGMDIFESMEEVPAEKENTFIIDNKGVNFKVQIGVFKTQEEAEFVNLSDLGTMQKKKATNGKYYYFLGNYATLDEAQAVLPKLTERGIPDPIIVAYKNGKKIDLSEAIKP